MTSLPSSTTEPEKTLASPTRAFRSVDLPAPFGPRRATISPLLTVRETSVVTGMSL